MLNHRAGNALHVHRRLDRQCGRRPGGRPPSSSASHLGFGVADVDLAAGDVVRGGRPAAADFVSPVMACFVAVYGAERSRGTCAEMEPLLMMPASCLRDLCTSSRGMLPQAENAPVRFTSTICRHFARLNSSSGTGGDPTSPRC